VQAREAQAEAKEAADSAEIETGDARAEADAEQKSMVK
jgi:hypothetical protein